MSASHEQHAHTCCHSPHQAGPDAAGCETTHATKTGAAAQSSSPMSEHAHAHAP